MGTNLTFRVFGLPPRVTEDETLSILGAFFDHGDLQTRPTVHSLGLNPWDHGRNAGTVATVDFQTVPDELSGGAHYHGKKTVPHQGGQTRISLSVDADFDGFTPLNTVEDDDDDYIE